ncbi:MAG: hypothetical protein LBP27_02255 [Treponema sp.]|jgi:hypothetical protein|nr:hypothetical protein [Treponema sp.]
MDKLFAREAGPRGRGGVFAFFAALSVCAVLSGLSCAGLSAGAAPAAEEPAGEQGAAENEFARQFSPEDFSVPEGMDFVPAPFPGALGASGVGLVSGESGDLGSSLGDDERARLALSFAEAYMEGIFRGLPLYGVLGGDRVHGWPRSSPLAWVQNWRGRGGSSNSWGIPSLILAVRGLAHDRVFVVQGGILDAYGQSAGLMGANGAAGYGAPLGNEFVYQGGIAQRFDFGLVTVDAEGRFAFSAGDAPSLTNPVPEKTGLFESGDPAARIQDAFQSAWRTEIDGGLPPLEPDTPLFYVDFGNSPWVLPFDSVEDSGNIPYGVPAGDAAESARDPLSVIADFSAGQDENPETAADSGLPGQSSLVIRGLYCQMFGEGRALFILADAFMELIDEKAKTILNLPFRPSLVDRPFLEVLLNAKRQRLSGAASLHPYAFPADWRKDSFTQALLEGIAVYGLPLSGPQPGRDGEVLFETQRFSRGWMRRKNGEAAPAF